MIGKAVVIWFGLFELCFFSLYHRLGGRKEDMSYEQNRNARIRESMTSGSTLEVETAFRDDGTLLASADVRERSDVGTGRSLTGLSVKTAGGRNIRFSGAEARTLLRVLQQAAYG